MSSDNEIPADLPSRRRFPWGKLALLFLLVAASLVAFVFFRDAFTLASLARHEAGLRAFYTEHPLGTFVLVILVYAGLNGVSIPGAGTALTLFIGWFFRDELWLAVLMVSFGSTAGAMLTFLLSRYVLRDLVAERFTARMRAMQRAFDREGGWYLLTLRLLPVVPYFLINILMGLTTIRLWTFWWVSQVGMLPATVLYTYTASTVPGLEQLAESGVRGLIRPQLFLGLCLLAVFPLAARWVLGRFRGRAVPDATAAPEEQNSAR